MKKILDLITDETTKAFKENGYDEKYGKVTISNRPDLCEYQCNGAMAAGKVYKKAPIAIAKEMQSTLAGNKLFEAVEAVSPGFLNIKISADFLADYLKTMQGDERLGCDLCEKPKTIIIDYGGPNVAKPLHVGHLRSAIIGESIKRIGRFIGHTVYGDVHLGDWGFQMGLIITELKKRKPQLAYFEENYEGAYPSEPPFTIAELEEIYPTASAYAKEHPKYKEEAMQATVRLQQGKVGYTALLQHILAISVTDLKKNYENLNVSFDLWKGESDAQPYIPNMVSYMKEEGYAYISEGALVVDVKEETDTKEVPPCMILKSDGASLYNTTDLATIVQRMETYQPDGIIYVVDKRQELYFTQVFRCARKTKLVKEDTMLKFLGFGTMNGKDGKPFKTREGGVMRLELLVNAINEEMYQKIISNGNHVVSEEKDREIAKIVALSAIKYGDLSNQASKDYIFDMERFTSFEGNTGPYLLYTIVRIKSILNKYNEKCTLPETAAILPAHSECEKTLMLELSKLNSVIEAAFEEIAPHRICAFLYDTANAFNKFYHETQIMGEEDTTIQAGYIKLLALTKEVLETSIDLLGFQAPERM
ncbi:arginine--tRNA ligase [Lachnospiraceae bacterium ZAX-1]